MKITLAPTDENFCPAVTIQSANDDVAFSDVLDMVIGSLIAYGFSKDTIDRGLQEFVDAMGASSPHKKGASDAP